MAKFVPRQRKHKVLARQKAKENARHEEGQDTNQDILTAEKDKRKQIKEELQQDGVKVSGKKAKRLEKYIDNKLRKDENRELLAKLAARKIDTSLFSKSSALGQTHETKRQAFQRALQEQNAGLEGSVSRDDALFERRRQDEDDDDGSEESNDESENGQPSSKASDKPAPKNAKERNSSSVTEQAKFEGTSLVSLGSGLKRPLDLNDEGRPVLKKRQKRGGIQSKTQKTAIVAAEISENSESESDPEEWGGFSDGEENEDKLEASQSDANSETSSGESTSVSDDDFEEEDGQERSSAFKAWAQREKDKSLGFTPSSSNSQILDIPKLDNFVPRAVEEDPLPMELQTTKNHERKAFSVTVIRSPEIQEARLKLPIVPEEQKLMEAVHNNDIVVICGATGSGKTTQVPQFLYEAGYGSPDSPTPGMIGVTQPRRVAAVSMSKRVAEELGDHATAVGYQIRFERTAGAETAVKFMTDGVLLRELTEDFTLNKYSAIIIDEAHERSMNTDILIGMLSRVAKVRRQRAENDPKSKPLKLIIMSATLRIEDMTKNPNLFSTPPPVVEVEGRQHPVTIHFSRRTSSDYVEEAFKKISRGHKKLPPGGFLVFLTGQSEITELMKRLQTAFGNVNHTESHKVQIPARDAPAELEDIELGNFQDDLQDDSDDMLDEDEEEFQIEEDQETAPFKMQVLPLYSLLSNREQLRVFEEPPEGTRQVILATNVAETSITIPGTRFVFDCGRSKKRDYDRLNGVTSYKIGWISKASASQRSGRAGRTGPGHCYRLYSSAVYERDFQEFSEPEMLHMPIEGVVLQLKAMDLRNVVNFPFPTPPERQSLAQAEKLLAYLSALDTSGKVTATGKTMSIFPLSPRLARILLSGHLHNCLHYTIAMIAALSVPEVFIPENQAVPQLVAKEDTEIRTQTVVLAEDQQASARRIFHESHRTFCSLDDRSDAIKLLQVIGEFAHDPTEDFCERRFVRFKVLKEIQQLRQQITDLVRQNVDGFAGLKFQNKLKRPEPQQVSALKQMVATGFVDQVAIRGDLAPNPPEQFRKPRRSIDVPYVPLLPLNNGNDETTDGCVYIHPTSPLAQLSIQECPDFVVYSYLQRATAGLDDKKIPKTRMHSLTDVSGRQLAGLAKGTPLISYGKPIKEIKPASGASDAATRECWVVPYLRAENTGGQGWPLPAKKVTQRKIPGKGWVVE